MEPEKKSNGALVGLIIILVILIIGGIYIWQSKINAPKDGDVQSENVTPADADALNALEQDLDAADTNVDVDVNFVD
ncbi:MAG: hypothetical protein UW07_C0030G0003 [Candidatus Nomurabacteria bacterium GW2011_GWF2_43_8]|uniref:Uncharacterized protein n=3 Tax=Candidatus Nomuraibacteriota TaxID=1752729 RepID=A0A0G1II13_9BACT|nr:MAG: hypothetical protein UV76_C0017G0011 [Candidatus Nomurabacteria bacterium GW2011_GWA2_43_15]KKT18810.1 MAG: hypothetical protein UW02_C0021G0008 [Candidatus Nomurabacteria bacterium GW2011_GWB1_43_7]KKT22829.1 MAG: hypothetical protein UW07_C0030G0003 [Candidatus Nomurabacteria bacterium GW2011_GWF2_43_8]